MSSPRKTLDQIRSEIQAVIEPYKIDISHVFSLFLSDVIIKNWIMFTEDIESDSIQLEIILASENYGRLYVLQQLAEGMNKAIPELKAEPFYYSIPHIRFRLNATAVQNQLVTWIEHELKVNPKKVLDICPYKSKDVIAEFNKRACSLKINTITCDFIEETLCEIVNYYFNLTPKIFNALSPNLPIELLRLILSYTDAIPFPEAKSSEIKIETNNSRFESVLRQVESQGTTYLFETPQIDFHLETKIESGTYITHFFNHFFQQSARVIPTEEKDTVTIRVHAAALMSKKFLSHYSVENISLFHNAEKMEFYQRKSAPKRKEMDEIKKTDQKRIKKEGQLDQIASTDVSSSTSSSSSSASTSIPRRI